MYAQYVSTLKPHHASNGRKNQAMDNMMEVTGPGGGRRRVYSLTYNNSTSAYKHSFPRRSLHNQPTGSQLNWSVEEELKRRRRLAGFDQSYGELAKSDPDSDPESGETTEADDHEWKQVGWTFSMGKMLMI